MLSFCILETDNIKNYPNYFKLLAYSKFMKVYEPGEDSQLLKKYVKKYAKGICLDVGTGTGIQAMEAAKKADFVVATDVNPKALEHCNAHIKSNQILCLNSDIFEFFEKKFIVVKGKMFKGFRDIEEEHNAFDTIIFNPPYLPKDARDRDIALDGGKKGYEVIEKFLKRAGKFLALKGIILLIFSSKTGKEKVDSLIKNNKFKKEELEKIHIFFEDIYCYKIENAR